MGVLDYRTAGESHGPALLTLVEGMPAGVEFDHSLIDSELARRQGGYGRGGRMKIEQDRAEIMSGLRLGRTTGSPIAIRISNRDLRLDTAPPIHRPRPGHADFAGSIKWLTTDCRNTLERASARETAARVAAGALSRSLLKRFGIEVVGYVTRIGTVAASVPADKSPAALVALRDGNEVYCPDPSIVEAMLAEIHRAMTEKDTVGGIIEVQVHGHPIGLGSCMRWQDKLDGRLMSAVGSVQAIKGVEIGLGFESASRLGSQIHDEIEFDPIQRCSTSLGFRRRSNRAGGLEGGMTNGEPIIVRAAMKPISTLLRGLDSVDLSTRAPQRSDYERSDICAVPAASVVAENVVAFEIARAFLEKFAGDTLTEVRLAYDAYLSHARNLPE